MRPELQAQPREPPKESASSRQTTEPTSSTAPCQSIAVLALVVRYQRSTWLHTITARIATGTLM